MHKSFGSDNHSGVHPQVMEALVSANNGHMPAYGSDTVSAQAQAALRQAFGCELDAFFVFTGTAANTLAIRTLCQSFEAVASADIAHINEDECGAPEYITGSKSVLLPHRGGKIAAAQIAGLRLEPHNPHRSCVRLVSVTQATELGTIYSLDELRALTAAAHARGLLVHMDGARLANAVATLGCSLAAATWQAGVDALSFGGTKNGLLGAEVLIFFKRGVADHMPFHRKQGMQLASKMRFLAAQFLAYMTDDLWLRNAAHANAMATRLRQQLLSLPGAACPYPTEANEVFVTVPEPWRERLQMRGGAYLWAEETQLLRLVTSFDTTPADVDALFTQ